MRFILQFVLVLCCTGYGVAQKNFNLELVSNTPLDQATDGNGNDIWGYVDSSGVEYAIMGTNMTTRIWSLEDPANPIPRATIPGANSIWRDIKTFEDHIYVTTDRGTDGLLIIDMSMAPDTITHTFWKPEIIYTETIMVDSMMVDTTVSETLSTCHNIYIDTDQGYAYLAGCNISAGGVILLDLNQDKKNPVQTGIADLEYSHDVYVKDDKMYTSEIFIGAFNVYDISDKTNPILLNGEVTSSLFTHNAWLSDDGDYLFTTDERPNAWVDAYDVSDLDNIKFIDQYKPLETIDQGVIPHNTHYLNGNLVTSWYTDGMVINDVNKPDNIVKIAAFDANTEVNDGFTNNGFHGMWGAYPYLPSGLMLGSDIESGLYVLRPIDNDGNVGFQRASYVEGTVTDGMTGLAIPGVTIEILSDNPNLTDTDLEGEYKTGQVSSGTFEVSFSHPLYNAVIKTAELVSGEVTIVDAVMGNSTLAGTVVDAEGQLLSEVPVLLINEAGDKTRLTTDDQGAWNLATRFDETYTVAAAAWGYKGAATEVLFDEQGETIELQLLEGYEDDFFVDLGWQSTGTSNVGRWELGGAQFLSLDGVATQTDQDIDGDIGTDYYVTGGSGNTIGENDIDGGNVVLTSPAIDLSEYNSVDISYHAWFSNVAGTGAPNDQMKVTISNGIDVVQLNEISQSSGIWSDVITHNVTSDMITFTDQMTVSFDAEDDAPGHVVEAGIDVFRAFPFTVTNVNDITNIGLEVYPNPTTDFVTMNAANIWDGNTEIIISDMNGNLVSKRMLSSLQTKVSVRDLPAGVYNLSLRGEGYQSETIRLIRQ